MKEKRRMMMNNNLKKKEVIKKRDNLFNEFRRRWSESWSFYLLCRLDFQEFLSERSVSSVLLGIFVLIQTQIRIDTHATHSTREGKSEVRRWDVDYNEGKEWLKESSQVITGEKSRGEWGVSLHSIKDSCLWWWCWRILSKEESRSEKEDKKLDTKIQEERKRGVKKECSHLTPLFSYTTSLYFIRRLSEREMVRQVPVSLSLLLLLFFLFFFSILLLFRYLPIKRVILLFLFPLLPFHWDVKKTCEWPFCGCATTKTKLQRKTRRRREEKREEREERRFGRRHKKLKEWSIDRNLIPHEQSKVYLEKMRMECVHL